MEIADFIGVVGGLAGMGALCIEGVSLWRKRIPRLTMFIPYHGGGQNTAGQEVMFLLVRISNSSERIAHMYLETLSAELLHKRKWHQAIVPSYRKDVTLSFDLDLEIQHQSGIRSFEPFNKFDKAIITMDEPYCRYISLYCDMGAELREAEELRITVYDCNLRKYKIKGKILKQDPGTINKLEKHI